MEYRSTTSIKKIKYVHNTNMYTYVYSHKTIVYRKTPSLIDIEVKVKKRRSTTIEGICVNVKMQIIGHTHTLSWLLLDLCVSKYT